MISIAVSGSYDKTRAFLQKIARGDIFQQVDSLALEGDRALANATPTETGLAAGSWTHEVTISGSSCTISWTNTDVESGFPVAIMLQYGYSTGTGGYVAGRDYINPAIRPVMDNIADKVWKVVTSS